MRLMRRNVTLDQVEACARRCNELGITYGYFTLLSFPDETLREAWDSVRLIERLAGRFDVLAENFKAATMERLSLGPEVIAEANPRAIVLSISGLRKLWVRMKRF